jgi:3-hydroxybutyryl-CoA dehydrogenase
MTGHNLSSNHFSAVAVIGAGLMGHGIAQLFATRNVEVHLHDIDSQALSRAVKNVASNLDIIAASDLIQRSEIEQIIGRIHTHSSMEEAVADAGLVVEAVSENVDLKQKVFRALDELCRPSVILATNTSATYNSEIKKGNQQRKKSQKNQ